MPELPDVTLYVKRLEERVVGNKLEAAKMLRPFVLRSYETPLDRLIGKTTTGVSRAGKRIVFEFDDELFLLIHLMIAGRFVWNDPPFDPITIGSKIQSAYWIWDSGRLVLTEASSKKRAGVWIENRREAVHSHDRGGLDLFEATAERFETKLKEKNRTLKRALTDPSAFDGIGNAFSDEILFAAKLSPVRLTSSLSSYESARLLKAGRECFEYWIGKLQKDIKGFPKPSQITAFRPEFFVHGKYGKPCQVCGSPIQHIVHAENETNYCAKCQNEGRLLADRSLSRLLKDDWPKTLEEMLGES
ncbi:MAG TPA: DNA-formamidopyrimidine glycosylase family protein [Fimbriimonas sp.]|nr:DNA-formamidopyrimidine glycosylase family protein [Fimbriimonas sp.]